MNALFGFVAGLVTMFFIKEYLVEFYDFVKKLCIKIVNVIKGE
jgi:hypothetical protein